MDNSRRGRGAPPEGTPSRILRAAESLFAERGFAGVSVREIASKVGLNQASLYNHFESKHALYEAVLEEGLRPIFEILVGGAEQGLDPATSEDVLARLLDHLWAHPELSKLIQREVLDDGDVLEAISDKWLRPLYDQARRTLDSRDSATPWSDDELPLFIIAMYHILFGHFSTSALLHRVSGVDPMHERLRKVHHKFVARATARLMGLPEPS